MSDELEQRRILQAQHLAAQAAAYRDRRERIATAALQGLLADPTCGADYERLARQAIFAADALIAELNKEVKP